MLIIDGSQGEGGGQLLRTSLSLSALSGRPFRIENIRARRSKPGLRPQHLTAVRAAAATCQAHLHGAELHSTTLTFEPQIAPQAGEYTFDVSQAAEGHSAGAVTLIAQTILWPLLFAEGTSTVTLHGGTQVPFSPPFHYFAEVARPAFAKLGATFTTWLNRWGWMSTGQGEIGLQIEPCLALTPYNFQPQKPEKIRGLAAVTNLPSHIPHRMARRAHNLLQEAGYQADIQPLRERSAGPGAGIVVWLAQAGFSALGRKGLPAEKVAESAIAKLLAFMDNGVAVDAHLADQLLLPMALAQGRSQLTTTALTEHARTNATLLRQWLPAISIELAEESAGTTRITVMNRNEQN